MSAHEGESAVEHVPTDDKILAARVKLKIDRRLDRASRPEVVSLAAMTMESERRRSLPIEDPTDDQIVAARLVLRLDERLGRVSAADRIELAALPTSRERRAQDS